MNTITRPLNPPHDISPILVTGAHRTGTTWVGKMLAASGQVAYISEPLNVWHRSGVMRTPVAHWYTYICNNNEAEFLPAMNQMLAYRYHLCAEMGSIRNGKDLLRMGRDLTIFINGRIYRKRPLLKDPFAVFSAPWFSRRLAFQVIVTVRHPAAFVSSLKRLGWYFDFHDLLAQPMLMGDWLEPFRVEMESLPVDDIIGQAALLWVMIYHVVAEYRKEHPDIIVVRHEDLSRNPLKSYQELYDTLNLTFTPKVEKAIISSSSSKNPKEGTRSSVHTVRLDSRANLESWKRGLSENEIARIRTMTASVSPLYYSDEDWE